MSDTPTDPMTGNGRFGNGSGLESKIVTDDAYSRWVQHVMGLNRRSPVPDGGGYCHVNGAMNRTATSRSSSRQKSSGRASKANASQGGAVHATYPTQQTVERGTGSGDPQNAEIHSASERYPLRTRANDAQSRNPAVLTVPPPSSKDPVSKRNHLRGDSFSLNRSTPNPRGEGLRHTAWEAKGRTSNTADDKPPEVVPITLRGPLSRLGSSPFSSDVDPGQLPRRPALKGHLESRNARQQPRQAAPLGPSGHRPRVIKTSPDDGYVRPAKRPASRSSTNSIKPPPTKMLKNESTYENASHQIPIHHSSSPPVIDTYTFPHRQDPDVGAPPFGSAALQRQWGEAFTSPQQQKTIPSASIFPGHTGAPVTSGIGGIGSGGDGGGNGGTDDDNDGFGTEWGSSGESGGEGDDEKSGRGEGIGSGLMLPQSPGKTSQPILLPTPRFSNRGTPAPLFPNGPPSRRAGSVRPNAVVPPFHTVIPPYSAKPVSPPYLSWILPTQQNYQADPFRVILSPASDAVSRDTVWNSPKDKWTKAKAETQTLYDTERKPQMLNSLRTALHVNPMLCCSDGKGYPLIVDLSNSEKDIRSIVDPEVRWRDDDVLNQPVTLPRVTRLRLISPKMSEPIEIVNRESVTVKDAFRSMFSYFKQPITWKELESFPDKVKKELEKAYFINAAKWTGNPTKVPKVLRRVDMLGNEPIFDGLHCDRDLVMEVTGELDVATLIMDFKSRIFMEW